MWWQHRQVAPLQCQTLSWPLIPRTELTLSCFSHLSFIYLFVRISIKKEIHFPSWFICWWIVCWNALFSDVLVYDFLYLSSGVWTETRSEIPLQGPSWERCRRVRSNRTSWAAARRRPSRYKKIGSAAIRFCCCLNQCNFPKVEFRILEMFKDTQYESADTKIINSIFRWCKSVKNNMASTFLCALLTASEVLDWLWCCWQKLNQSKFFTKRSNFV